MIFESIFERYNNKITIFQKSHFILTKKLRTNLTADITYRRLLRTKNFFIVEKLWFLGLNYGDKGDYIDVWMIKITIKAKQTDTDKIDPK